MARHPDNAPARSIPVPAGVMHVAQAGTGAPIVLLHQTPRSWDEFRDVVPILGERFHAIAIDTIGFGDSSTPTGPRPRTRSSSGPRRRSACSTRSASSAPRSSATTRAR